MTRTRVLAAMIAAAALTLGACSSSTAGSPTASAPVTSSVADESATGDTSAVDTSSAEQSASEDVGEPGSGGTGSSVAPVALDAQSTTWFTAFCEIAPPFDEFFGSLMGAAMAGAGTNVTEADLVKTRDTLEASFTALGSDMSTVGAKLATLDPPTVPSGADGAAKAIKGLTQGGPMLAAAAGQVAQLDTSSAEAFTSGVNTLMDSISSMGDMFGSDELGFDDSVKAAVAELPGCKGSMLVSGSF